MHEDDGRDTEMLWVAVTGITVFIMQVGFLLLEHGTVRRKNSISVMFKNIGDCCLVGVIWWLVGYGFSYGKSTGDFIGTEYFTLSGTSLFQKYRFYQSSAYASTCVTIASGAVTERIRLKAYYLLVVLIAIIIYPVPLHWISRGWLSSIGDNGFIDSAGGGIIHYVGGMIAVTITAILGPRKIADGADAFSAEGYKALKVQDNVFSTLGVIFLFTGWIAFNMGSALDLVGVINSGLLTLTTSSAALITEAIYCKLTRGFIDLQTVSPILITSLAGSSGCCTVVRPRYGLVMGIVTPAVYRLLTKIRIKYHIDDVVNAFSTHTGGGLIGVISVGLFAERNLVKSEKSFGLFLGGGAQQIGIQLLGLATLTGWSMFWTSALGFTLKKFNKLRVSYHDEQLGLDAADHGTFEIVCIDQDNDDISDRLSVIQRATSTTSSKALADDRKISKLKAINILNVDVQSFTPSSSQNCSVNDSASMDSSIKVKKQRLVSQKKRVSSGFSDNRSQRSQRDFPLEVWDIQEQSGGDIRDILSRKKVKMTILMKGIVVVLFTSFLAIPGLYQVQDVKDIAIGLDQHMRNSTKILERKMFWVPFSHVMGLTILCSHFLFEAGCVRRCFISRVFIRYVQSIAAFGISWVLVGFTIAAGNGAFVGMRNPIDPVTFSEESEYSISITALILVGGLLGSGVGTTIRRDVHFFIVFALTLFPVPAVDHWVSSHDTWLQRIDNTGYLGPASGTAIHIVSGFSSLIVTLLIGPRIVFTNDGLEEIDPFSAEGRRKLQGTDPLLSGAAAFLSWPAYTALSCSMLSNNESVAEALICFLLGPSAAVAIFMFYGILMFGYASARDCSSVILCAVSTISGFAGLIHPAYSVPVGIICAIGYLKGKQILLILRIDDTCNTILIHGGGGLLGSLAATLFADQKRVRRTYPKRKFARGGLFYSGNIVQFLVQLLGIVVIIIWICGWTWILSKGAGKLLATVRPQSGNKLRIPRESEIENKCSYTDDDVIVLPELTRQRQVAMVVSRVLSKLTLDTNLSRVDRFVQSFELFIENGKESEDERKLLLSFYRFRSKLEHFRSYLPDLTAAASFAAQRKLLRTAPESTVAISFTSISDSESLWLEHPEVMAQAVTTYFSVVRSFYEKFHGYEVKTVGDRLMCVFQEVTDAVKCYCDSQSALLWADWPRKLLERDGLEEIVENGEMVWKGLRMAVGIAYGAAVIESNALTGRSDYLGKTANLAARLTSAGEGGIILISLNASVELHLSDEGKLYSIFEVTDIPLKGIGKVVAYAVSHPSLAKRSWCLPYKVQILLPPSDTSVCSSEENTEEIVSRRSHISAQRTQSASVLVIKVAANCTQKLIEETIIFSGDLAAENQGVVITACSRIIVIGFKGDDHICNVSSCAGSIFSYIGGLVSGRFGSMAIATGILETIPNAGMAELRFSSALGVIVGLATVLASYADSVEINCLITTSDSSDEFDDLFYGIGDDPNLVPFCKFFRTIRYERFGFEIFTFDVESFAAREAKKNISRKRRESDASSQTSHRDSDPSRIRVLSIEDDNFSD